MWKTQRDVCIYREIHEKTKRHVNREKERKIVRERMNTVKEVGVKR